jgi:phosphatidylglycerophosphatase A
MTPASQTQAGPPASATEPQRRWTQRPVIAILATGLGFGFIRPYSGSWGSIPAVVLAWALLRTGNEWLFAATTVGMIAASVWVSSQAEGLFGHDSGRIVIDEFAGVFVCFLGLPGHWHIMIPLFVLFRIIDVVKPPPCRRLERLPSGWGVTADDIGAGIYTNILVRILVFVWPGWFGLQ